ncbi:MAG: glycoside hydrolase family 3 N-terminal domain-containing protein, partial [Cyclobacteriaceae bacterium]
EGRQWAQQMIESMSIDQQIGQLIHVAAWSNKDAAHEDEILHQIQDHHLGGLIFFQGNPKHQAELINLYQSKSKVPLMISIDGEWGLGMRLEACESFPYQMTLGAIQNLALIEEMGKVIARQMKRVGVTLNHAPVIDVNTNPENPVINFRSFGQDKRAVAERAEAYMRGLQGEHVLACAKHFPGHGDTAVDSHVELPMLDKSKAELAETELYPFKKLFEKGIGAVMVAHLQIPQLEPDKQRASTLSKAIITDLLKKEMGFNGLVITDALDMRAVADHYAPGKVDVEALLAGNDILLFVKDVRQAVVEIKQAIAERKISEKEIAQRCLKQLMYKYWMGLSKFLPLSFQDIAEDVNEDTAVVNDRLYAASLTLVHGKAHLTTPNTNQKACVVSLFADGDKVENGALSHHTLLKGAVNESESLPLFEKILSDHLGEKFENKKVRFDEIVEQKQSILNSIDPEEEVVLAIHDVKLKAPDNFGITQDMIDFVSELLQYKKVHLVFFGNPYALAKMSNLQHAESILMAYQENKYTYKYAAEALIGRYKPIGKLPVDINEFWPAGHGL